MNLDAGRLRLLAEVARHGSMTAAAEHLAYTTSAVSQQIRKLEAELGHPVLERHSWGVELTDAGREVVDTADAVERQLQALQSRLDDISGLRAGSLRLATFPTAGASLLPSAIRRFRAAHPGVRLSVQSARSGGLLELLERRAVEVALLWDYPWSRISADAVELRVLHHDPTALLVWAGHPLSDRSSVSLTELGGESWVTRSGSHPVAEVLSWSARTTGFEPTVAFEASDYQEAQAMVAVGLGVALAPRLALTMLREDVRVVPIKPDAPERRILLGRLAGRPVTPAETAMTAALVRACEELGAPHSDGPA